MLLAVAGMAVFSTPASAASHSVSQVNQQFTPASLVVDVGDSVNWNNDDTVVHSVMGGPFSNPEMAPGQTFSYTFNEAGTFEYTCRFHPSMRGSVEVRGGGAPPPEEPTPPPEEPTPPPEEPTPPPEEPTPPPETPPGDTPETPANPGLPIGVGPVPIQFHLTDNQGAWFDTNLNVFGTRSLAVAELPRVSTGTVDDVLSLLKLDLGRTIGNVIGVEQTKFNMENVRTAVDTATEEDDPRAGKASELIDQLLAEVAKLPQDIPIDLSKLPVGVELTGLLTDLANTLKAGISLPVTVNFDVKEPAAESVHTATSLIWPEGAKGFPYDQPGAWLGNQTVQLTEPGLYAFACKIHPYMLGAVVVDDPLTPGLDFGKNLVTNIRGGNLTVPSNSDVIAQLVQTFFKITSPGNWQHHSNTEKRAWNPSYPPVPILTHNAEGNPELIPDLDLYFKNKFKTPKELPALDKRPAVPGVGEIWVDTQMEKTAGKEKSGTATKINAETWAVERKVALPQIGMNNPHNMWTDKDYKYIYQTEWFSDKLDVFDRETGAFVRQTEVGPDPSHVMTRTDTDQLHVAINGGSDVVELAPGGTKIDRRIPTQDPGEKLAHPHAHWMSADGRTMVTPNVNSNDSTIIDIPSGTHEKGTTGQLPIATGMMPDASKVYQANFLGQSVTCASLRENACNEGPDKVGNKEIDLWDEYDPVTGEGKQKGGLPIQIPVSPDGTNVLVANTMTASITVIDTKTDEVVKTLPCDAGCHGINYGAKKGGGYYAYVSSKFSNALMVVDPDPNGDGNPEDAAEVGKFVLEADENTQTDDEIVDHEGMGGQGILPLPLVYNGWSQKVPDRAPFNQLTCSQRNPISPEAC